MRRGLEADPCGSNARVCLRSSVCTPKLRAQHKITETSDGEKEKVGLKCGGGGDARVFLRFEGSPSLALVDFCHSPLVYVVPQNKQPCSLACTKPGVKLVTKRNHGEGSNAKCVGSGSGNCMFASGGVNYATVVKGVKKRRRNRGDG